MNGDILMSEKRITTENKKFERGVCLLVGGSDIFWRVLEYDAAGHTALLIADKPVRQMAYNDTLRLITWEECSLRAWLNGDFLNTEFSEAEREAILYTDIHTANNPRYGTKGGNDTRDRVFIPDTDEVERLFENDAERAAKDMWWLRSPGHGNRFAIGVDHFGTIRPMGSTVDNVFGWVRPMMRVNLDSSVFDGRIRRDVEGNIEYVEEPRLLIDDGVLVNARMSLEEAVIPEDVVSIGDDCFASCTALKSLKFEGKLDSIAESAFKDCTNICDIEITPEEWDKVRLQVRRQLIRKSSVDAFLDCDETQSDSMRTAVASYVNMNGVREQLIREQITNNNSLRLGKLLDSLTEPLPAEDRDNYLELADSSSEVKILLMEYRNRNGGATRPDDEFELDWA